jgi:GNAT superfamily N-acetyltransferase
MKYFIFDYSKDCSLIDSFLESASLAHKNIKKSKDWFYWKFRDNPYGESVLSCIKDNDDIVGCVAYGMQRFICNDIIYNGAFSFETFINPRYQGQGIFKELLINAEKELKKRNIVFLLNFPNSKSISGFLSDGWIRLNVSETWLKVMNYRCFIQNIKDIKREFIPFDSDIDYEEICIYKQKIDDKFCSEINAEYLRWRFYLRPNCKYFIVDNSIFLSIARIGKRGRLLEAQLLYVNIYRKDLYDPMLFINSVRDACGCDIITMPVTKNNKYKRYLLRMGFAAVPNRTNVCYKILDLNFVGDMKAISLYGINYHTY